MQAVREGCEYLLQMEHICKKFSGIAALSDASLRVKPAEVHALIGQNGAGKSTMIKILTGAYLRDSGDITFNGATANFTSPQRARGPASARFTRKSTWCHFVRSRKTSSWAASRAASA